MEYTATPCEELEEKCAKLSLNTEDTCQWMLHSEAFWAELSDNIKQQSKKTYGKEDTEDRPKPTPVSNTASKYPGKIWVSYVLRPCKTSHIYGIHRDHFMFI